MRIRSLQLVAFAALFLAATAFAVQTTGYDASDVCTFEPSGAAASLELASLFQSDGVYATASLFDEAPSLTYALDDAAFESEDIELVTVSDVTSCMHHGDVI
jgi:hypothetical protein